MLLSSMANLTNLVYKEKFYNFHRLVLGFIHYIVFFYIILMPVFLQADKFLGAKLLYELLCR